MTEEIGGLEVFTFGAKTPKLHSPKDWLVRNDGRGSTKIQRLRQAEEHDDKHSEVEDRRQIVTPSGQINLRDIAVQTRLPVADELAQKTTYRGGQNISREAKNNNSYLGSVQCGPSLLGKQ